MFVYNFLFVDIKTMSFAQSQDLMREQAHNVKSVNLVQELCHFMAILHSNIDSDSVVMLCELFDTMNEVCQGNVANQVKHILYNSLHNNRFSRPLSLMAAPSTLSITFSPLATSIAAPMTIDCV